MKKNKQCIAELVKNPGRKYHFFVCPKGSDGKPIMMMDSSAIPEDQRVSAMSGAKSNLSCTGKIAYDEEKNLNLTKLNRTMKELVKVVKQFTKESQEDVVLIKLNGSKAATVAEPDDDADANDTVQTKKSGSKEKKSSAPEDMPELEPLEIKPTGTDKAFIQRMKNIRAKRYDNVTAPSPGLTKLLDLRQTTVAELESKHNTPEAPKLLAKVEQIDQQIEKLKTFSTKEKGKEYVGEDKEFGFRRDLQIPKPQPPVKPKPDRSLSKEEALKRDQEYLASVANYKKEMEAWEDIQHKPDKVTTYDTTPEAKKASEVHVDEKGQMRPSTGGQMQGKKGYVVDPKTGKMHHFDIGAEEEVDVEVDDPDTGGKKIIKQKRIKHHTTPLAGEEVAGAGDVEFKDGVITSISNSSGHYKPKAVQLIQTLEELLKQGVLQDKTYEMLDDNTGKGKPLNGKMLDLYTKMAEVETRIWGRMNEWRYLKKTIDDKQAKEEDCTKELEDFEKLCAELKPDTDVIARTVAMLKKHGAAPSNRIRDVKVEFSELKDTMTGAEVKKVETTEFQAKEFLETGGGDLTSGGKTTTAAEKKSAKKALHAQLEQTLAKRRAALDAAAEKLASELPEKLAAITNKIPQTLEGLERIYTEKAKVLTAREKKELETGMARLREALKNPNKYGQEGLEQLVKDLEGRMVFHEEKIRQEESQRLAKELGLDQEISESSDDTMPVDDLVAFAQQKIKDPRPGKEGYTPTVEELADDTHQTIEQIFEKLMGRKPITGTPEKAKKKPKKAKEKPDDLVAFAQQKIKDPRPGKEGYTPTVEELADDTHQTIEQIFEKLMGRKPITGTPEKAKKKPKKAKEKPDDLVAFAQQKIKDPRPGKEGYTPTVEELADDTHQTIEQIFEKLMGRKPRV